MKQSKHKTQLLKFTVKKFKKQTKPSKIRTKPSKKRTKSSKKGTKPFKKLKTYLNLNVVVYYYYPV